MPQAPQSTSRHHGQEGWGEATETPHTQRLPWRSPSSYLSKYICILTIFNLGICLPWKVRNIPALLYDVFIFTEKENWLPQLHATELFYSWATRQVICSSSICIPHFSLSRISNSSTHLCLPSPFTKRRTGYQVGETQAKGSTVSEKQSSCWSWWWKFFPSFNLPAECPQSQSCIK